MDALLGAGCDLTALVLPGEAERLPRSVRAMVGDITDADAVARALEVARPEGVFHLAAVGTTDTGLPMAEACRVNVGGMIALLEGIRRLDSVERIVVIGTSYEYGARRSDDGVDPFNTYSASKVAAWAYARAAFNAWGLPVVSVRPFQVYGPGQRREALVPTAILAALGDADFRMTGASSSVISSTLRTSSPGCLPRWQPLPLRGASSIWARARSRASSMSSNASGI